jgi:uncharacterized protein (DUF486 family)
MPALAVSPYVLPVLLLIGSNAFMTTAWYWHLRFKEVPLWQVILISWGLAFFEYWMAVPANRYGSAVYSAAQLKTIQEVVTLTIFGVFSVVYLGQAVTLNQAVGFALIAVGAFFVFRAPL